METRTDDDDDGDGDAVKPNEAADRKRRRQDSDSVSVDSRRSSSSEKDQMDTSDAAASKRYRVTVGDESIRQEDQANRYTSSSESDQHPNQSASSESAAVDDPSQQQQDAIGVRADGPTHFQAVDSVSLSDTNSSVAQAAQLAQGPVVQFPNPMMLSQYLLGAQPAMLGGSTGISTTQVPAADTQVQAAGSISQTNASSTAPQAAQPVQGPTSQLPNPMMLSQYLLGAPAVLPPNLLLNENPTARSGQAQAAVNAHQLSMLYQMMSAQQARGGPNVFAQQPFLTQQALLNPLLVTNPFGAAAPFLANQSMLNTGIAAAVGAAQQTTAAAASIPVSNAAQEVSTGAEEKEASTSSAAGETAPQETSTFSLGLYVPSDDDILSDHQILLRKQIELFEAEDEDTCVSIPGRRKPIAAGQVGIRCRHCARVVSSRRARAAVYFPFKLEGLYQAAQNMAVNHFIEACETIDPRVKMELRLYREEKTGMGHGGKKYWAETAKILGVVETEDGLRFDPNVVNKWKATKTHHS